MNYELALVPEEGAPKFYPVNGEGVFIGRSKNADIPIGGDSVSRRHARVWVEDSLLIIEDLSSRNGICVNGERTRNATLREGDELFVGQNYFKILDASKPRPDRIAAATPPQSVTTHPVRPKATQPNPGVSCASSAFDLTTSLPLLFNAETMQKHLSKTALDLVKANRSYLVARGAKNSGVRILAAATKQGNPDGPPMNHTLIEKVMRTKTPIMEGAADLDPSSFSSGISMGGAMCAPLMGQNGCVGVVYVDAGVEASSFDKGRLDALAAFGSQAGLLLETTARMKEAFRAIREQGREEGIEALGKCTCQVIDRVRGAADRFKQSAASNSGEANGIAGSLRMLDRALQRGAHLTENIAAYCNRGACERGPIDVSRIIVEVVERVRELAETRDVVIRANPGERVIAYAGYAELCRIVENLVVQGIDACDASGGAVTIAAANKPDGCYIEVGDPGDADSVKVPSTAKVGGAPLSQGLEFATVCKLVMNLKGAMKIRPRPEGGRAITVVLPQQESSAGATAGRD